MSQFWIGAGKASLADSRLIPQGHSGDFRLFERDVRVSDHYGEGSALRRLVQNGNLSLDIWVIWWMAVERAESAMNCDEREFHLAELESLRELKASRVELYRNIATYVPISSAAIYAFLLTTKPEGILHLPQQIIRFVWFLPFILAVIGAFLAKEAWQLNTPVAEYIKRLEVEMAKSGFGFENTVGRWKISIGWYAFWGTLCCFTLVVGIAGFIAAN